MKIKKVYIAKRIPKNPPLDLILNINSSMTIKEIHSLYIKKTIVKKNYIHNGHWILRPPISENKFTSNPFHLYTKPADICQMVK